MRTPSFQSILFKAASTGWSLCFLLLTASPFGPDLEPLLAHNTAAIAPRLSLILAPLGVAAISALAAFWSARRGAAIRTRLDARLDGCCPLWALWPIPCLLQQAAFAQRPVAFMLLVSLLAFALYKALWVALPVWSGQVTLPVVPRWAVDLSLAIAVATFIVLGSLGSIRVHHKMLTSTFDLGLFENLFFNSLNGRHGVAVEIPYFGQHAELVLYALVPIYKLFPSAETLLILQATLMGATAIPLYLIARRHQPSGVGPLVIALAYLFYPAVHGPLFFDFHFLSVSGFFITWAAYFVLERRLLQFWVALVLAMACREDVALGVAAVAIISLVAAWPRPRLAAAVALVAGAWFAFLKFYWMQSFLSNTFAPYYADLIPEGQSGFGGIALTLLSNPLFVLGTLLREDKLLLALQLLVPLCLLPVARVRLWPLLVPGFIVVGLATSHGAITQINFHYITHFVPYLFVGTCLMLGVVRGQRRTALLGTMVVASFLTSHQFGACFVDEFKTSFHTVSFDWTPQDAQSRDDFLALAAGIPKHASVSAGEHEGPHLAARPHLVSSKYGLRDYDFAITSRRSLRWGGGDHMRNALKSRTYGVVGQRGDFLLIQRGAPTDRNPEGMRFLR